MEERENRAIARMLHEAKLPRMKTLEAFEFDRSSVSAARIRELAVGEYVAKAEPILLGSEGPSARKRTLAYCTQYPGSGQMWQ